MICNQNCIYELISFIKVVKAVKTLSFHLFKTYCEGYFISLIVNLFGTHIRDFHRVLLIILTFLLLHWFS